MMKKSILIFLILLCISNLVFAQNKTKLDSLTLLLKDSKKDSTRVIILNQLWRYTLYNNTENSIKYANDMISFSKSINYPKGIGLGHQNLGVIASQNSDYETAKDEFKKALSVYKTNKLKKEEAFVSSQIATDFFYQGKYDSAIYYNALSREKFFNYRDTLRAGSTYVLESAIFRKKLF